MCCNEILDSELLVKKVIQVLLLPNRKSFKSKAALGEKITRQGVNVGLDDLHESLLLEVLQEP